MLDLEHAAVARVIESETRGRRSWNMMRRKAERDKMKMVMNAIAIMMMTRRDCPSLALLISFFLS